MRRVRRKGGNKEKVFGCDLLEHLTTSSQEIPPVLRTCSEFVEQHGIVDGIYRLSGVSSNIQKLRGEFENDGAPDLNKDVYLQDIHCVSSLCKAYFRELPNPLLTYQLYDKFAEAVAIQLEEERLIKIRDVLKELPEPHYRTLEFLMRHLVRMASYSSETNMHARNLAIVWAPNLLRSKDIEASGFNGTAAFMEVRVQSIVVEFILTHVPQLFPLEGLNKLSLTFPLSDPLLYRCLLCPSGAPAERRKSLPSPTALPNQDVLFFKSSGSQPNFGNISPGDGPLAIRPYHAIIEGTDKRKGSLKGRKWMSIFHIGGRFPDPRKKHKHSTKEKDRTPLRPARSMDSLSTPSYPNEGSRRSGPRPPSSNMSPAITSSQPPLDTPASGGGLGSSEYAVTYRRGTGLVSGGAGTQGTYTALDPDGLVIPGSEGIHSRSPGLSNKARRAAMHITGPTLVTVPLHITSNLALGVLQGGGDRVILRGRDKDGGDKQEGKEAGGKIEIKEPKGMEWNVEASKNDEQKDTSQNEKEDLDTAGNKRVAGDSGEVKDEGVKEKGDKESGKDGEHKEETQIGNQHVASEKHSESSVTGEGDQENIADDDQGSEYMEMKCSEQSHYQAAAAASLHEDDAESEPKDFLNSTEVEGDEEDQKLSGYVQDNFEFLDLMDQMDYSAMDHMDCSMSYQVNEFSVEPPCHSDDEYEMMAHAERPTQSVTEFKPHRPLSLDLHSRHTKSLSLPYMKSPVDGPVENSSSDEEVSEDDGDGENYSSEEDESMFVKSLPSDFFLNTLSGLEDFPSPDRDMLDGLRGEEERSYQPLDVELPVCTEPTERVQENAGNDEERQETKEMEQNEVHHEDQLDMDTERTIEESQRATEDGPTENCLVSETSAGCCEELELPSIQGNQEINKVTETEFESGKEVLDESEDASLPPTQHPESCAMEDVTDEHNMSGHSASREPDCVEGPIHREHNEEDNSDSRTNSDIWSELEDVVCEVIEDEESKHSERNAAEEADGEKDGEAEEENETNKTEDKMEEEEEPNVGKPIDEAMAQERNELELNQEGVEEVVSEETEKEKEDKDRAESRTQQSADKQLLISSDIRDSKEGSMPANGDSGLGCVGRKLVVSKEPKIYQVKAVPVVPPKPQHCKMTALTLRHQQQQRDRRDNTLKVPAEQEREGEGDRENAEKKDRPSTLREKKRDALEGGVRDAKRNSPLSMCFDEAVAIATLRREKERGREGDAD
ncbi:rho GTPase-activating protein 30 isoform X2 [Cyprinodon tularosa]|uniref:rho GTPase-activating protein 30 isoform X2 n=1 Tax=Cyprinodon tularosa TaxID=77115 RepID=UPI0018E28709|nr:rho GTPase-activating protein 30 isoform X2 [Cyprinodon tularosa]